LGGVGALVLSSAPGEGKKTSRGQKKGGKRKENLSGCVFLYTRLGERKKTPFPHAEKKGRGCVLPIPVEIGTSAGIGGKRISSSGRTHRKNFMVENLSTPSFLSKIEKEKEVLGEEGGRKGTFRLFLAQKRIRKKEKVASIKQSGKKGGEKKFEKGGNPSLPSLT